MIHFLYTHTPSKKLVWHVTIVRWYFTLSKMNMSSSPVAWGKSEIILLLSDKQWQIYFEVTKIKIRPQMSSKLTTNSMI